MAILARKLAFAYCLVYFCAFSGPFTLAQVPTLAWMKSIYGHGNTDAVPGGGDFVLGKKAMAIDLAGNVYVTGSSSNGSNVDFLTVKYNASGVIQWRAVSNGAANGGDVAYALALDAGGNVIVTGTSYDGSQANFLTVKYSSDGAEQWRATLNGALNGDDEAYAIAVDSGGNIYVTGTSFNGSAYDFGSVLDYLTVKYNPAGAEQWRVRTSGPGSSVDRPYAIAVDGGGNVVVTGYSSNGASNDYLTVKLNSSGVELWRRAMDGVANGSDLAFALAIDSSNNIVVAGQSHNGINTDYLTVKYDAGGTEQWRAITNGDGLVGDAAHAVAVDPMGNVIVTGQSDLVSGSVPGPGNPRYLTVKYSPAGAEIWRKSINGAGTGYDIASAIASDTSGNIYVTGYGANGDLVTVKYLPDGSESWRTSITGAGSANGAALVSIGVDGAGDVLVAGYQGNGNNNDFLVVKFNSAGTLQWRANEGLHVGISTAFGSDAAGRNALKVDAARNIHIAGRSNYGPGSDFLTAKYDADGNELWRAMANGAGDNIDQPYALALDSAGNVYVTGDSYAGGISGMMTVKYSANGAEQWRMVAGDGATTNVSARLLAVDAADDVIVTGLSYDGLDFLTVKYSAAGVEQWRMKANRAAAGSDTPVAMVVDAARNVYVTGRSVDGINDGYLTVKYNSAGIEQWRALENASDYVPKRNFAMALDAAGNLVVAGDAIVKYDANGAFLWRVEPSFQAQHVSLDSGGNIVVAGTKGTTAKYSPAGVELWSRAINTTPATDDVVRAMAMDNDGNIYVSAQNYAAGNSDYMTVKFDPAGTELWRMATATQSGAYFASAALAVDASRGLILASNAIAPGNPAAITLTRYRPVVPSPSITSAIAGNSRATISFLPPAGDGGSPITGYTATCDPGAVTAIGARSPIVVTGLQNDVSYSCNVVANSAIGASLPSASVIVTPTAAALPVLISVHSRKTHGAAGDFDLPIGLGATLGGAISVESRVPGTGHLLVFLFSEAITSVGTVSVNDAQAMPAGTASAVASGNEVMVLLTGIVGDAQVVVSMTGINGVTGAEVSIGFRLGDFNDSRSVGQSDISAVKARTGQTVDWSNFRYDVNVSGSINAVDIAVVKARAS